MLCSFFCWLKAWAQKSNWPLNPTYVTWTNYLISFSVSSSVKEGDNNTFFIELL